MRTIEPNRCCAAMPRSSARHHQSLLPTAASMYTGPIAGDSTAARRVDAPSITESPMPVTAQPPVSFTDRPGGGGGALCGGTVWRVFAPAVVAGTVDATVTGAVGTVAPAATSAPTRVLQSVTSQFV